MRNESQFGRFKGAAWFPQNDEHCMVGGAGGIGSWLTFFLSKAGFKPMIYDFDHVEEHNLGGQLFKQSHVGQPKVTAVAQIIEEFNGDVIQTSLEPITAESPTHHFMFSAFDNMQARKDLFEVWKRSHGGPITPLFIDGRLEMEQLQIFCVTPENMENYEENQLFSDSNVPDLECTLKQTSHAAAMIASHMVGFFTNHIANVYERQNIRAVPYYYEYFIPAALSL
jgi:molybdopterin/thiamine biosynthesis adenylyltransferase